MLTDGLLKLILKNIWKIGKQQKDGWVHEALGNIISQTGTAANNYKFSTKNLDDESELYYFGARYYDSETGRFITKDPDGGDVTNPQSLNPYVYVRNNPVNLVDPDGEMAEVVIALAATTPYGWVTLAVIAAPAYWYGQWYVANYVGTWAGTKLKDWMFAKEHTKGARPSTKPKHEKGQSRKAKDKKGSEKGDVRRPYRRK